MKIRGLHGLIRGIVLLAVCFGAATAAAQNDQLADLEDRIRKLEEQLALRQEFMLKITEFEERLKSREELAEVAKELREDSVSKMVEEFKRQYEQEITAIHNEQDKFMNAAQKTQDDFKYEVKQQTLLIETVWKILLLLGIVTVLSVFYTIFIHIRKLIEDEVHRQIGNITDIQKDYIRQIVDEKVLENRLKKEKILLLLSAQKGHKQEVENFFESMGFNYKSLYFNEAFDFEQQVMKRGFKENRYDLVIFNQLSVDEIDAYMEKSSQNVFMAYAPYTGRLNVKSQEKMNFANSPFTIYSRTMETLQYQEFMKA